MDLHVHSICFTFLLVVRCITTITKTLQEICPAYKKGPSLNVADIVGSWMTVYLQPELIDCFVFRIRATTELEREQNVLKYGSFNDSVEWSQCFLQVLTPVGKHFLQGNGTLSGLMENIIILEEKTGQYQLQNASADQWMVFGRRGSEVLMTRDCAGETVAAFARVPYWPNFQELSALFHRSGMPIQTHKHSLCKPQDVCRMQYDLTPRRIQKEKIQKDKRP